jgi:outer membrane protein
MSVKKSSLAFLALMAATAVNAGDWYPTDPLFVSPAIIDTNQHGLNEQSELNCTSAKAISSPLSLGEAIDVALCNNAQIKVAWASIKQQSAQLGQARATYLPTINVSTTHQYSGIDYPSQPGTESAVRGTTRYAGMNWRLFDFGGRSANNDSARFLLNSAISAHMAQIQKTATNVIQAYFDTLTAEAVQMSKQQSAGYARQTYEASLHKEGRGAAPLSDALQAKAALAKAELATRRAEGDFKKAKSTLAYTIGIDPEQPITLSDVQHSTFEEKFSIQDLNEWLDYAKQNHPAILAAEAKVLSAERKIDAAQSEGLPTLDFFSNYYQNGLPNQAIQTTRSNTVATGFNLNIPLFEGFARTYKIREAQSLLEQAQAQLENIRYQTVGDIIKAHADATSSLENLKYSESLMNAALSAVESTKRRYDKNAGDILELLTAQSGLADAEQERIRCLAEWRSARLRLISTTGKLSSDSIN